jgi:hypothetical protein
MGTGDDQMASISYRLFLPDSDWQTTAQCKEQWKKDFSMTGSSSPSP